MILGPMPASSEGQDVPRVEPTADLSTLLGSLYGDPILTREQEVHLFPKDELPQAPGRPAPKLLDPAPGQGRGSRPHRGPRGGGLALKNQIVCRSLCWCVSVVKQALPSNQDFAERVSDGYLAMIRAVEKFDFSRGYKFSTYVSWAIMNNLSRDSRKDHRHDLFVTGYGAMLEAAPDHRDDECSCELERQRCREAIRGMLGRLSDRERIIIVSRFGLEGTREKTLNQLGEELGITKERVRQLEIPACDKLREIAAARRLVPVVL